MGMAVVKGRAVCPYVLPVGRRAAQTGEGEGGGSCVLLEEFLIRAVVAKSVGSGKEGLWGVKYVSATEGIGHGRPYANARAKQ